MAHVRQKFALGAAARFRGLFGLLQFRFRPLALGYIAYKCGEAVRFTSAHGGDSQLYREFTPVSVQRRDLNHLVQHRTLSGGKKAPETLRVSITIAVRNNHLG